MNGLLAVDLLAGLFFASGFILAFKPDALRALQRGSDAGDQDEGVSADVASALRIGGVMIMAFSTTICVFANLFVHYSATSR